MKQILGRIILILTFGFAASGYGEVTPSENQVKAAYLYNFAKFIKWPDSAFADERSPLVIGVFRQDGFVEMLMPLASRSVRNRPIVIKPLDTLMQLQGCHLFYISESVPHDSVLKALENMPVISVGEGKNFAAQGGVIQLIMVRGRLRFIINLDTAKNNGLQIDAQLLSLASEVLEAGK
jgi:hypothetical protein